MRRGVRNVHISCGPILFILMQFSAEISQNNRLTSPLLWLYFWEILDPPMTSLSNISVTGSSIAAKWFRFEIGSLKVNSHRTKAKLFFDVCLLFFDLFYLFSDFLFRFRCHFRLVWIGP